MIKVTPPDVARMDPVHVHTDAHKFGAQLQGARARLPKPPPHALAPLTYPFLLSAYPADHVVPAHDCYFFRAEIRGHHAHALADTGATKNFISADFPSKRENVPC